MKNGWKNISIRNISILLAIPLIIVIIISLLIIVNNERENNSWKPCPWPELPEYNVLDTCAIDGQNIYIVYFPERHEEELMRIMARLWWDEGYKSIVYFYDSKDEAPIISSSFPGVDDIQSVIDYIMKFRSHCIAECSIYPDGSDKFIWYQTEITD